MLNELLERRLFIGVGLPEVIAVGEGLIAEGAEVVGGLGVDIPVLLGPRRQQLATGRVKSPSILFPLPHSVTLGQKRHLFSLKKIIDSPS